MFSIIILCLTSIQIKLVLSDISHNGAIGGYVYESPRIKALQITNISPTKILSTTLDTINEIESSIPKQATVIPYTFNLNNFNLDGIPTLSHNFLTDNDDTYIADGRLLKQYEVMEHIPGDYVPDDILNKAPLLLGSLLAKFSRISPSLLPSQRQQQTSSPFLNIQPVTRNHGPIALGSGALGYIRLPNGGVYLGSGSLGYISGPDRIREINDVRMRRIIQPSPVVFGTTHLNK